MSHYVEAFPVSAKLKEKLKRRGFSCVDDFAGLKVKDLVEEVGGIKSEDAAWLLDHCQQIKGSYIKDFSSRWFFLQLVTLQYSLHTLAFSQTFSYLSRCYRSIIAREARFRLVSPGRLLLLSLSHNDFLAILRLASGWRSSFGKRH